MKTSIFVISLIVISINCFSQGSGSVTWNAKYPYKCCEGSHMIGTFPYSWVGPFLTSFTLNYTFTKSENSILLKTSIVTANFDNKIKYNYGSGGKIEEYAFQLFTSQKPQLNTSFHISCEVFYNGSLINIPDYDKISCDGNTVFSFGQATADKFPVAKQARDNNYNGTWEIRKLSGIREIEGGNIRLLNCEAINNDFQRFIEAKKNREKETKQKEIEAKKQEQAKITQQSQSNKNQTAEQNNNSSTNSNTPAEKKGRAEAETQALINQLNALEQSNKEKERVINESVGQLTDVAMAVGASIAAARADKEAYKAELKRNYYDIVALRDQNKIKSEIDLWTEKNGMMKDALVDTKIVDACIIDLMEPYEINPEFWTIIDEIREDIFSKQRNIISKFGFTGLAVHQNVYNKDRSLVASYDNRLNVTVNEVRTQRNLLAIKKNWLTDHTFISFSDKGLMLYRSFLRIYIYQIKPEPKLIYNIDFKQDYGYDLSINNDFIYCDYDPLMMIMNFIFKTRIPDPWRYKYNSKKNILESSLSHNLYIPLNELKVSAEKIKIEAKTLAGMSTSFNSDGSKCTLLEDGKIARTYNSSTDYFDSPMKLMFSENTKDKTTFNYIMKSDDGCKYLLCFVTYSEPDVIKVPKNFKYTVNYLDGVNDGFCIQLYDFQTRKFICELKPNIAALYDVKFVGDNIEIMGIDKAGLYGFLVYKTYDIKKIVDSYKN